MICLPNIALKMMQDFSNLSLKPVANINSYIDIGNIHYIPEKGAYYVLIGYLTEDDVNDTLYQIWVTNYDNPYGANVITIEEWDNWLEVYSSIEDLGKNIIAIKEHTVVINPLKIQIDCSDYLEQYLDYLRGKHLARYNQDKRYFDLTSGFEETFKILMKGRMSRKPIIDKLLESLE